MDDKGREMFTFQVSAEEAESINAAVRASGLSRSEYLRQRLTNPMEEQPAIGVTGGNPPSKDTTILLQHVLYGLHCVHAAIYAVAEATGALSAAQSAKIAEGTKKFSLDMLAHLDERITAVRQQIKPAEAQVKKTAQEIKDDGVSRSV